MPEAKVVVACMRRRQCSLAIHLPIVFAGALGDRRRRTSAGGDKLGYFTGNLDFGLFGEIGDACGAA
jgi:hypothetical protein